MSAIRSSNYSETGLSSSKSIGTVVLQFIFCHCISLMIVISTLLLWGMFSFSARIVSTRDNE